MAPSPSAAASATPTRPRVGLLYTHESPLSREGEYLAKYIGLALASTGATSKVAVVGVDVNGNGSGSPVIEDATDTAIVRADSVVFRRSNITGKAAYDETCDVRTLRDCHVWLICLDAATSSNALQFVQKRTTAGAKNGETTKTPKRRVIISLQPAMRQLRELESTFSKDTVLHGGACFHVTQNKHSVLYPLSHGCFFIERLTSEKTDALFALDLLEATGFQVLSRKNVQALKWGHSMLRLFYYLNALTGESVAQSLSDRAMRLVYLEMLFEMDTLFEQVATSFNDGNRDATARRSWAPDASACTYLSIHTLMVLLPLPNWFFNRVATKLVDVGLTSSLTGFSTIARDVDAHRETEFWTEFKDVFDLAKRRNKTLPALTTLQSTLAMLTKQQTGTDRQRPKLSGRGLLSQIPSSRESRAVSRTFFVKVIITVLATLVLILYFLK